MKLLIIDIINTLLPSIIGIIIGHIYYKEENFTGNVIMYFLKSIFVMVWLYIITTPFRAIWFFFIVKG